MKRSWHSSNSCNTAQERRSQEAYDRASKGISDLLTRPVKRPRMAATGPIMDWTPDAGLWSRFKTWKRNCLALLDGPHAKQTAAAKANTLKYWCGTDGQDLLETEKEAPDQVKTIFDALEIHAKPHGSIIQARMALKALDQAHSENIFKFLAKAKEIVKSAEFGADLEDAPRQALEDEMLRDAILGSTTDAEVQGKALREGDTLTLERLLEIIRQEMAARRSAPAMAARKCAPAATAPDGARETTEVAAITRTRRGTRGGQNRRNSRDRRGRDAWQERDSSERRRNGSHSGSRDRRQRICQNCGYKIRAEHHCPARDRECRKCGKVGHFQSVCRSAVHSIECDALDFQQEEVILLPAGCDRVDTA